LRRVDHGGIFRRLGVDGSDGAVVNEALGQLVTIVVAYNTLVVAVRAKIKIAVVTDGAVVVIVGDSLVAAVAADGIARTGREFADRHRSHTGGTAKGQAVLKILDAVHGLVDACHDIGALNPEIIKSLDGFATSLD
jgi:hypothetical protein